MAGYLHGLPTPRKHKARICPVEWRVRSVYGAVMVRTDEHHIVQRIIAAPAQPVYVVRFTEITSVLGLGVPFAKLAHAFVQHP